GGAAAPEPQELRRRAFATLRALLDKIAGRGPLVVFIDDAQWGDRDSAPLLAQLMRPPNVPPLMLLLSYRTDDAARSPLLSSLLGNDGLTGERHELTVGPLTDEEAHSLAHRLLVADHTSTDAAATIARESRGHPYFIHELARHVKEEGLAEGLSLDAVIAGRVQRLPEPARRLMEIVAVAGQPISQTLIGHATVVDNQERVTLINQLRVAELIRTSGVGDLDTAECYHDRIRELLVSQLAPERLADSHRRIALAMLDGPEAPDPEALALHFHGAGDLRRAFAYATKAADRAAAALAFDRAASLYRLALEFESDADVRRSLNERLGDALRNAGRGMEAAAAYRAAAEGASVERRLICQRLAAEQLLYTGHVDEGLKMIENVLANVHMRLAKTPTRAVMSLLWRRLRLRMRGLGHKARTVDEIPAEEIQLIDTCYGVGTSLSLVDTVRGADFQALNLRLSLQAGEPYRIARSLALEAGFVSSMGVKMAPRVRRLLDISDSLAQHIKNPHAIGMVILLSGISAYEAGELRRARDQCYAAEEVLRTQCSGVAWEIACGQ
ncbi:MAG TPA: AAA family ATPase, partial [Kofleriaceae bacterium]|nr:AAA family ATPase [Kofleriaceae bacterium]